MIKITGNPAIDDAIFHGQCWATMRSTLNETMSDPNVPPEFVKIAGMQLEQMQVIEEATISSMRNVLGRIG